jgi:predicted N-acetyltransferase YhbS
LFLLASDSLTEWQFLTTAAEHSNIAYGKNVQSNGFFLQMLGTSTEHQNKGIGRAMIKFYEPKVEKSS